MRFDPWLGQNKDFDNSTYCSCSKHVPFRSKNIVLDWNRNNVSEWSDMSIGELFQ